MKELLRILRRLACELWVDWQRITQPVHPKGTVIIFPGEWVSGSASDLRAIALTGELRKLGWRALCVPHFLDLPQRQRVVRRSNPDVILLQMARHFANRPKYYPGIPCVFDIDDADMIVPERAQGFLECLRESSAVIAGSQYLADTAKAHNNDVSVVWTATYLPPREGLVPNADRPPVVTWAHSNPMLYPAEANFVRDIVLSLAARGKRFSFQLYGVDPASKSGCEQYAAPIREAGIPVELFPPMPYADFVRTLGTAAIGLHPVSRLNPYSAGKGFGKILAYLAAGVVVVATNVLDYPRFFRSGENGVLAPDEVSAWGDEIAVLLDDPQRRGRIAEAGRRDYTALLMTPHAARQVSEVLDRVKTRR